MKKTKNNNKKETLTLHELEYARINTIGELEEFAKTFNNLDVCITFFNDEIVTLYIKRNDIQNEPYGLLYFDNISKYNLRILDDPKQIRLTEWPQRSKRVVHEDYAKQIITKYATEDIYPRTLGYLQ